MWNDGEISSSVVLIINTNRKFVGVGGSVKWVLC